jgi:hypothetical protein
VFQERDQFLNWIFITGVLKKSKDIHLTPEVIPDLPLLSSQWKSTLMVGL